MKAFKTVMKIVVALAAVAAIVYVVAAYGDKIVAWCKDMCKRLPCCKRKCECNEEAVFEATADGAFEEAAAEEVPVAEEADFEG